MKKKMNLKSLEVKSFVTNLNNNYSETVKGGSLTESTPINCITYTQPSNCNNCEIETDNCGGGGATTAGPGGGNTGWPPSQGCSNNSCEICYIQ